ncbi:unnamed protein product [Hymenolepis diminuta]|uniref:Uncharacterized protein n=1 Tax=Hymenolepis diminuta TaxID=6216 RepID=A0A564YWY2_HYMDI|nr:unnamed protein product [Hymenolepis diminuta]
MVSLVTTSEEKYPALEPVTVFPLGYRDQYSPQSSALSMAITAFGSERMENLCGLKFRNARFITRPASESGYLGSQPKESGKLHTKRNPVTSPIVNNYQ